eukprot:COSAG02_NODE_10126_length_2015_cov_1.431106_3_plen_82_part_00
MNPPSILFGGICSFGPGVGLNPSIHIYSNQGTVKCRNQQEMTFAERLSCEALKYLRKVTFLTFYSWFGPDDTKDGAYARLG